MAAQRPARASPELRVAPLGPRYRRNYTTSRDAIQCLVSIISFGLGTEGLSPVTVLSL